MPWSGETRRSGRLRGFDYRAAGAYFLTVVIEGRRPLLADMQHRTVAPTPAGHMVTSCWEDLAVRYPGILLDAFVVMPDHLHGILRLGVRPHDAVRLSIPEVMHRFKSLTTRRYFDGVDSRGWPRVRGRFWQRGYHERVIRGERHLEACRAYIQRNPCKGG